MCSVLKEKKYDFWKSWKMIYEHDTDIEMIKYTNEVSKSRFMWFIYRNNLLNQFMPVKN